MLKKILYQFVKITSTISPNVMAKIAVEKFSAPRRFDRSEKETICYNRGKQVKFTSGRIANIWGENGNSDQPLVLLIHGWESRGTAFYTIIEALVEQGFKALAWNAPAHGASPGSKTEIYDMANALVEDIGTHKLAPAAIIGHSMGGAIIGLLDKYIKLPHKIVIISAPSMIVRVFWKRFKKYGMSDKAVHKSFTIIETLGDYGLDDVSLYNSELYQQRSVLVVHDENDREISFSEFSSLQQKWKSASFHATKGLGHRRIIRDETLAKLIANHLKTAS